MQTRALTTSEHQTLGANSIADVRAQSNATIQLPEIPVHLRAGQRCTPIAVVCSAALSSNSRASVLESSDRGLNVVGAVNTKAAIKQRKSGSGGPAMPLGFFNSSETR